MEMKNDGLFMPKRTKRPSELITELRLSESSHSTDESRSSSSGDSNGRDRVVIVKRMIDNDKERRAHLSKDRITRWNTQMHSVDGALFKQNVIATAQLAAYLYLDATTVIQYCFYWLGEYNNPEVASHLLFNNMIDGLLRHLPILEIAGQYGLKYKLNGASDCALLLRFAGSDLHRVPHVHFTQKGTTCNPDRENAPLLRGLSYAVNPLNKCFLNVSGPGMHAELQADNFVYNTVLEEFYEPSFIILTCYMLTLNYQRKTFLYNLVSGKKLNKRVVAELQLELDMKCIDLIETSLIVLETYVNTNLETPTLTKDCIDVNDKNGTEKRARLVYDLVALIVVMREHKHDREKMYACVAEQWLEKAKYCASEMATRMTTILEHL